jgi:hypothetical protein
MTDERPTALRERVTPNRLGALLRVYRTLHNRDLRAVAAEIGISHSTLARIEHGQAFDADTLLKVWQWLLTPEVPRP